MADPSSENVAGSRMRALLGNVALVVFAMVFVLGGLELAFRAFPALLPAGAYGSSRFDPELGLNVHAAPLIYNKVRRVLREPNDDGFMDIGHARDKPAGVVRVGFFGDSYVESVQVPLDVVFFRQLQARLGPGWETFGFGVSGWGPLHSLLAYEVVGERYDLDIAVLLFVENDLGDQYYPVAMRSRSGSVLPFAEPDDAAPEGYRLRWSSTEAERPRWIAAAKWLQRESRLMAVVRQRWLAFKLRGVQLESDAAAVQMSEVAGAIPNANDLPSTWPADYRAFATQLGERVLARWKARTEAMGARLVVLYVPRGEDQLMGRIGTDQTWLPWLRDVTSRLGLELIDPSEALRQTLSAGQPVYDDHWSPTGHATVAGVLARALRED